MDKINILIADDHKLIRDAWSFILNSDSRFDVISACGNAEEAVQEAKAKSPHIILMDINMEPFSGLEATRKICIESPSSRVIGVSMHAHPGYAKKMLKMGAFGYITKNSSSEEMINAILAVNDGNKYICEEIKNNLCDQVMNEKNDTPKLNSLTRREIQIVDSIKEGFSSRKISEDFNIAVRTVEAHRYHILKKLKLKNSISLVKFINSDPYKIRYQ
ncbi:MAG TPA: response regulator transcription factor [Puia sp.]|jgi:DNA-binding NarL/FixJ family response regulator